MNKQTSLACCAIITSLQVLPNLAAAHTPMTAREKELICPLVSEMATVATEFRDKGMDEAEANTALLHELEVDEKPEKTRAAVSKLATGVTMMVYATPTLDLDTQAGFHFCACLLDFYADQNRFVQQLPTLIKTAEKCQQENPGLQQRIQCILKRFKESWR